MKKFFAAILVSLIPAFSFAQPTVKVQVPNLVGLEEQFSVTFTIEGERSPQSFNWSQGPDFQLVWGPQKGTSSSVSFVNGKTSRSSQTTYSYVLLPLKTGTFQLPAAEAVIDGEKVTSRAANIQVVSNGSSSQGQAGSSAKPSSEAAVSGSVPSEDLFLRLSVSKSRAVVGEILTATLKLYQRTNLSGIEDAKFPSFNGFWSQETQTPSNIEFHRESIGDKIYNAALLRSWTLIPQQAGDIRIDPAELVCQMSVRAPSSHTGSIFDSFFQDEYRTVRKRLVTDSHIIHVSSLPSGAPASFGGGVGSFRMSASVSRDSLRTHDAASLKVAISGVGNVALLEAPKISFPPDFEVYDVKTSDTPQGKTFEFPFIPRSHGDFILGPVEYSYYDVSQNRYVTMKSEEMTVSVSRGKEDVSYAGQTVAAPAGRKDVKNLGSDIRFIATRVPSFSVKGHSFAGSLLFWSIAAMLVLFAAVIYLALERRARMRADVAGVRSRSATKMARRRLSAAGDYLGKGLYSAFYEELHRALSDYVADKLGMDMTDMSKENIASRLLGTGVPEDACSDFVDLLNACEFARYSPSGGRDEMSVHFAKAVSVISVIDDSMKKRHNAASVAAVLLLALLVPYGANGADRAGADSLWNAGVAAYADAKWDEAARNWIAIVDAGFISPELYNNIGNAFFKQEKYAEAVLFYERALRLDPSFEDAGYNLEFVGSLIQDRIETVPEFFLKSWIRSLSYSMSSRSWAIVSLCLFALALAMALLFLLSAGAGARKTGFFSGLSALAISILCLTFSLTQKSALNRTDEAVVTAAVSPVKSSPASTSVDLFVLHEGTKVKVLEVVGGWCNIELGDGRQGWIREGDAQII